MRRQGAWTWNGRNWVSTRERRCWLETPLKTLRERGAKNGLNRRKKLSSPNGRPVCSCRRSRAASWSVGKIIVVAEECLLSVIATLRNVVRHPRDNDCRASRQGSRKWRCPIKYGVPGITGIHGTKTICGFSTHAADRPRHRSCLATSLRQSGCGYNIALRLAGSRLLHVSTSAANRAAPPILSKKPTKFGSVVHRAAITFF